MSWTEFDFELQRDYPISEIVDALIWIDDFGGIDKVKERLRLERKEDSELHHKYISLENKFKKLEKRHNDLMTKHIKLTFKLLMELREYAHSTYVRVNLDEEDDIIVYRPYEGDLFKTDYLYHFFRVRKDCPRELLYVFDKMRPIPEICRVLTEYILSYHTVGGNNNENLV